MKNIIYTLTDCEQMLLIQVYRIWRYHSRPINLTLVLTKMWLHLFINLYTVPPIFTPVK